MKTVPRITNYELREEIPKTSSGIRVWLVTGAISLFGTITYLSTAGQDRVHLRDPDAMFHELLLMARDFGFILVCFLSFVALVSIIVCGVLSESRVRIRAAWPGPSIAGLLFLLHLPPWLVALGNSLHL